MPWLELFLDFLFLFFFLSAESDSEILIFLMTGSVFNSLDLELLSFPIDSKHGTHSVSTIFTSLVVSAKEINHNISVYRYINNLF